jgi:hypothetical protein
VCQGDFDQADLATSILDPRAGTQDLSLMDLSKDRTEPMTTTRGFTASRSGLPTASDWPTRTSLLAR